MFFSKSSTLGSGALRCFKSTLHTRISPRPSGIRILARPTVVSLRQPEQFFLYSSNHSAAVLKEAIQETDVCEQAKDEYEATYVAKNFTDIEHIHPITLRSLSKVFKYTAMSKVQHAVLSTAPTTEDMFVKAKTGTGKTLAFLIPAIDNAVARLAASKTPKYMAGRDISVFIISPTRELAQQIAVEAQKLCAFHPLVVHCLVGGESKRDQLRRLRSKRCDIIVGTPGRLNDLLSSTPDFATKCEQVQTLILDEADQLLDMGFKEEIQRIVDVLPKERQTYLFSATVSPQIRQIARDVLRPQHAFMDLVDPNEANTHLNVKQSYIVQPYDRQVSAVSHLLAKHADKKIMVFLPTTKSTQLYADVFRQLSRSRLVAAKTPRIFELHSKKNQAQRTRISDDFRRAPAGSILFTSDVSARGVDYPNVGLVLQVGIPTSREQYIHRLGRTGRAGKDGEGVLMIAPFEEPFVTTEVPDLPLVKHALADVEPLPPAHMDETLVQDAFFGYLGYYSSRVQTLGYPRNSVLDHAQDFIQSFGVEAPHVSPQLLSKMGLRDKQASRSRSRDRSDRRSAGFSGFRGRRSDRPAFKDGSGFRYRDDADSFSRNRERKSQAASSPAKPMLRRKARLTTDESGSEWDEGDHKYEGYLSNMSDTDDVESRPVSGGSGIMVQGSGPTNTTAFVQQADLSLALLKSTLGDDGWKKALKHKSGVVVFMRSGLTKSDKTPVFKGEKVIQGFGPQAIFYVIGMRKLWDDTYEDGNLVENLNDTSSLTYEVSKTTPTSRARDLALVEKIECTTDGKIFFACSSIETPKVPRIQGRVRGNIKLQGWILEPLRTSPISTRVTFVIQESMKGWVPNFAKKSLARRPLVIAHVDAYLKKKAERMRMQSSIASQDDVSTVPKLKHRVPGVRTSSLSDRSFASSAQGKPQDHTPQPTSMHPYMTPAHQSPVPVPAGPLRITTDPQSFRQKPSSTPPSPRPSRSPTSPLPHLYQPNRHTQIQKKTMEEFKALASTVSDWKLHADIKGVKIYTKPVYGNALPMMRGDGVVKNGWTAEQVCSAVQSFGARKFWDKRFEDGKVVDRFSQKESLVHLQLRGIFPLNNRDISAITTIETDPVTGIIFHVTTSVNDPLVPKDPKCVRAHAEMMGWIFSPKYDSVGNTIQVDVTFICQLDLKGNIPSAIVRILTSEIPRCVSRVDEYLQKFGCPPYIRRVAGKITEENFNVNSSSYEVTYLARHDGSQKRYGEWCTDVRVGKKTYPHGFEVVVVPEAGVWVDIIPEKNAVRIFTVSSDMEGKLVKFAIMKKPKRASKESESATETEEQVAVISGELPTPDESDPAKPARENIDEPKPIEKMAETVKAKEEEPDTTVNKRKTVFFDATDLALPSSPKKLIHRRGYSNASVDSAVSNPSTGRPYTQPGQYPSALSHELLFSGANRTNSTPSSPGLGYPPNAYHMMMSKVDEKRSKNVIIISDDLTFNGQQVAVIFMMMLETSTMVASSAARRDAAAVSFLAGINLAAPPETTVLSARQPKPTLGFTWPLERWVTEVSETSVGSDGRRLSSAHPETVHPGLSEASEEERLSAGDMDGRLMESVSTLDMTVDDALEGTMERGRNDGVAVVVDHAMRRTATMLSISSAGTSTPPSRASFSSGQHHLVSRKPLHSALPLEASRRLELYADVGSIEHHHAHDSDFYDDPISREHTRGTSNDAESHHRYPIGPSMNRQRQREATHISDVEPKSALLSIVGGNPSALYPPHPPTKLPPITY
ncbi:hypothetical protein BZG36_05225, partial [Bifiguratus adelaidae]